jgi:PAS domain-containing protein/CRP-like cAMP-binding protein
MHLPEKVDQWDLRALFDQSPNPVCMVAPIRREESIIDLRLLNSNAAFAKILGFRRGSREGALVSEAGLEDFRAIIQTTTQALETGKPRDIKICVATASRWFNCTFAPSKSGNVVAFFSAIEERKAGNDGGHPISLFSNFSESDGIRLIIRSGDGKILGCNRAACEFYGWGARRLKSMRIQQIDTSLEADIARTMVFLDTHGLAIFQTCHRTSSGVDKSVEVHSYVDQYKGEAAYIAMVQELSSQSCQPLSSEIASVYDRRCPVREEDFSPLIERYGRDLPYLKELVRQVLPYGQLIKYNAGEHFLEYGHSNPNVGFILKGLLRKYTLDPDGTDCTLKLRRAGEILYVDPRREKEGSISLALEAMTECLVFVVGIRHFGPLVDGDIRWSKLFYRTTMETQMSQLERDYSLLREDASERFNRFMKEDGDTLPFLHSYHIASYLGITSETLSRIRKARTGGKASTKGSRQDRGN